jgi:polyhydroxybutyrate depolymerase
MGETPAGFRTSCPIVRSLSLRLLLPALFALAPVLPSFGQTAGAAALVRRQWQVGGDTRQALLAVPLQAHTEPTPVIFAFHGHGGNMQHGAELYHFQRLWPEAIVIYPQGLPTVGPLTDPDGVRNGWQHAAGVLGDRDLKFFDVMLASLRKDYRVDEHRIYATGHSNGGGFTYLLWSTRGDIFAAFAGSASAVSPLEFTQLKPKPVLHIAGRTDELVKFVWQQRTIEALRRLNQSGPTGQPYQKVGTLYPSKLGAPVATYIFPGPHSYPAAAPALTVAFFKDHAKP